MSHDPRPFLPLRHLAAVLCLGSLLTLPALSGSAAEPVPADDHAAEYKTLTVDFVRLDGLFEQYTDPVQKLTILGYINLMKGRAEALKENWDQVKYEELRYDINLQCQRIANWLAPLRTPPPAPRTGAASTVAVAKLNPSVTSAAEVKAALDALDREIKRLDERLAATPAGTAGRDAEAARVKRIKERRTALGKEFTKAGWDTLVADLK